MLLNGADLADTSSLGFSHNRSEPLFPFRDQPSDLANHRSRIVEV